MANGQNSSWLGYGNSSPYTFGNNPFSTSTSGANAWGNIVNASAAAGGGDDNRSVWERYMPYILGGGQMALGAYGAHQGAQDMQQQNAMMMLENRREEMNRYLAAKSMAQADLYKSFDTADVMSAIQGVGATQLDPYARNRYKSRLQLARLFGDQLSDYTIERGPRGFEASGGPSTPLGGLAQYIPEISKEALGRSDVRFDEAVSALVPAQREAYRRQSEEALGRLPGGGDPREGPMGALLWQQALRDFATGEGGQEEPEQEGRGFWRNFARIAGPVVGAVIPGVGPLAGGMLSAYGNSQPGEFGWGSLAKGAIGGYLGGALMGGATGTPWREAFNPNVGSLGNMSAWRSTPAASFLGGFRSDGNTGVPTPPTAPVVSGEVDLGGVIRHGLDVGSYSGQPAVDRWQNYLDTGVRPPILGTSNVTPGMYSPLR